MAQKPLEMLAGFWKDLKMLVTETLACYILSLMRYSGWCSDDLNTGKNADSKGCAHDVSDKCKESIENWTRGH